MTENEIDKICDKSVRDISNLLNQIAKIKDRKIDKYFSGRLYKMSKSFLTAICVHADDPDIIETITKYLKADLKESVSEYLSYIESQKK